MKTKNHTKMPSTTMAKKIVPNKLYLMQPSFRKRSFFSVFLSVVLLTSFFGILYGGCKHELMAPNPPSYPTSPDVPTEGICFQENILPILQSNCALSGCHDAITSAEDLNLSTYSSLMASGIVNAGDPTNSKLYQVLIVSQSSESFMPPPPHLPLTATQEALIYWWISEGALNTPCTSVCDTNTFTFSGAVSPIVQSQCQGCHSGSTPSGSLLLDNYANIVNAVDTRNFYARVTSTSAPMPPAGLMSACKIKQIQKWIAAGKLNN
jgi:hypothetical protein